MCIKSLNMCSDYRTTKETQQLEEYCLLTTLDSQGPKGEGTVGGSLPMGWNLSPQTAGKRPCQEHTTPFSVSHRPYLGWFTID